MEHFAVIGCPISHSRSPEVYADIFSVRGVNADCVRMLVLPHELSSVAELTKCFAGFAVTMPHKRAIIPYLDKIDVSADRCGAVNIVKRAGKRLIGFNTDGLGLVNALRAKGFDPAGKHAAIYGRGGAALSAAFALQDAGADVCLLTRSLPSAPQLPFKQQLFADYNDCVDLFINATPLGMKEAPEFDGFDFLKAFKPQYVFDMVYLSDGETELIKAARALGCGADDGYAMLYHQALLAADIWLGSD